ncbi:bifunctional riboflavin kinase/FAD synthetase [Actinomadura rupiterrae]|uniref:bifunctional riboflavin kinase/FAD synthetase n=1 Tax=Actinomadura rupiterrae TaxID=559627 RepID=UPI0020A35A5C|nr:bifunctional riboflavin kinase/FAD synthetase [Actinomadura rupiterrae]MCP2343875.1 riboflavin kinase/FMN adenylyltransferase [Actinomadura rupiterrae]
MVRVWHGLDEVPADWGRSVVTAGVFDGVHRGHGRIVRAAAELARERGLRSVAVTFDPHPDGVVRPGGHPPLLTTTGRRAELLGGLGVDAVLVLPFTAEQSQEAADEFVRRVLVDGLRAEHVIVGADFRFGHRARGDVALLTELGAKYDFTAEGMPLVTDTADTAPTETEAAEGAEVVSSTRVRAALEDGDVAAAARALGRPHRVEGIVVRGHQRGRALGFPTANLETPPHAAIPKDGVYAGWLVADTDRFPDFRWPAAISIGTNPTFEGAERTVEAYALDRDDLDLYGEHMAVDFLARIRDTLKFDSIEALIEEMHRDVARSRDLTAAES